MLLHNNSKTLSKMLINGISLSSPHLFETGLKLKLQMMGSKEFAAQFYTIADFSRFHRSRFSKMIKNPPQLTPNNFYQGCMASTPTFLLKEANIKKEQDKVYNGPRDILFNEN